MNRLTVFVHIGAPKSGTTFLQNMLWSHRSALKAGGVLYPYDCPTEHFEAMLDLREQGWGNISRARVRGAWQRVARRVREWDGHTAILTNELLGRANPAQMTRLFESLVPADVHVLYTARDLATQLASSWQEQVKHNLALPFDEFVTEMVQHGPGVPAAVRTALLAAAGRRVRAQPLGCESRRGAHLPDHGPGSGCAAGAVAPVL